MADSTETKTYLIKIESNYKQYLDDLIKAKKALDDAKYAQDKLSSGQFKSREEIAKTEAEYRQALRTYKEAQKMVELSEKALNSEAGSRKQLNEVLKLQRYEMGKVGEAIIQDANGINILNPKLIELKNDVVSTTDKILKYDEIIKDGRSNVGRYGDALSTAFAGVGEKITSMIGPMALVTAAVTAAKKVWDGLKEAFMSTTFLMDTMNNIGAVTKQLFYDIAINGKMSMDSLFNAIAIQKELNALRVEEGFETLKLSKINREEQAVRELSIDRTKTHAERLEYLTRVTDLETEKTKIKVDHLNKELEAKQRLLKQQPANEKLMQEILNLQAKINDTYAEEDQAMRRVNTQRTGFIQEEIDQRKKLFDAYNKAMDDANKKADDLTEKRKEAMHKQEIDAEKEANDFIEREIIRMDKEAEDKWNAEVELQRKIFAQNRKAGQAEYDARIAQAEALAKAELEIQQATNDSKINLAKSLVELLNSVAGESKTLQNAALVAERAFAIAQIIINTIKANNAIRTSAAISVLPGPLYFSRLAAAMAKTTLPVNINRAAAIVEIAAIIASTISGLSKTSTSSANISENTSTAITSTPAAQYSTPVGSTVLTQPQLTQNQLNTISSENLLTAKDIADALSKIPAPVVTVEDINAKQSEVNKIKVRANI